MAIKVACLGARRTAPPRAMSMLMPWCGPQALRPNCRLNTSGTLQAQSSPALSHSLTGLRCKLRYDGPGRAVC